MANTNIYPIQLLNDLHNWFPDILYNPGRFRNVQDLLDYIRTGADVNPYSRGLQQYRSRQNVSSRNPLTTQHTNDSLPTHTVTRIRTTTPLNNTTSAPLLTTLVGLFSDETTNSLFNQFMAPDALQNFLGQTVIVHPSSEEIALATTVYTAVNRQVDICTICQDSIDERQVVRKITSCGHYFHKDCIDSWFLRDVHCPTCRHDIRENTPQRQTQRTNIRQTES
jgi:hypothetical protein